MGKEYEFMVVPDGEEQTTVIIKERHPTIPLWPLQEPDDVDCSDDRVPALQGQRKVIIPKFLSMTKVLFRDYRLDLYSFLNRCLRVGRLNELVGTRILDSVISAEICDFKHVDYWLIDRENFYADVLVELDLQTSEGPQTWTGYGFRGHELLQHRRQGRALLCGTSRTVCRCRTGRLCCKGTG